MSRTADDWQSAVIYVASMRDKIRESRALLDDWPTQFVDVGEDTRELIEYDLKRAEDDLNTLLGECFVDWAWIDEQETTEDVIEVHDKGYAICPLCKKPIKRVFNGSDPTVAYQDGFHHKDCLDAYYAGKTFDLE